MKTTIFMLLLMGSSGCALIQKTSKTKSVDKQSAVNQLESSRLVLKRADKETQIFTYWNDSGFYQFQHIKEQVDQSKLDKIKTEEKKEARQTAVIRKMEPGVFLGVLVVLLVLGAVFLVYKWFYR